MTASIPRALALFALACAAFSQGSCVEKVELFCCVTPESCASKDAPYPTLCEPGFVCDETKELNPIRFTCVASEFACGADGACADPARPECLANNICGCTSDASCPASAATCDVASRTCSGCTTNDDCARFGDSPRCDVTSGECVACQDGADCPSSNAPVCSAARECTGCSAASDCERFPDTQQCEPASGTCVACLESSQCETPTSPVCEGGTCRGCQRDDECLSGLCDEGAGSCVAETTIVYIAPTGSAGPCNRAAPCKTFAQGLARIGGSFTHLVARSGSYNELVVVDGKVVTISGAGAALTSTTGEGSLLTLRGSSNVTIEGLRIHGADGVAIGDGISCQGGAGSRTVSLRSVQIDGNARRGIDSDGCRVTILNSALSSNAGGGIVADGGTVDIGRSTISGNAGGGVSLESGAFSLLNNVIHGNGSLTSSFGGVRIVGGNPVGSQFGFNTITRNQALDTVASGAQCLTTAAFTASSSIVYANRVEPAATPQVSGNCTWAFSDVGPVAAAGTGNINSDPQFKAPTSGDFHLQASSPAVDKADPSASVNVDFDGDARPQPVDGRRDMGADEVLR